jgi:hypothetical protein
LIKSRAERNEIYHNWLEGAFFHELELIGPDPDGAAAGWSDGLAREDSDVVGNVILHTSAFGSVLRFGGDGTAGGRGESFGRYRVVNNTILRTGGADDRPTIFRLFEGIESLELHNNIMFREGSNGVTLVRAVAGEVQWVGNPKVRASNNWIKSGFLLNPTNLPIEISATVGDSASPFLNLAALDLLPTSLSGALNVGTTATVTAPDYNFASPLLAPTHHPVRGAVIVAPPRPSNGVIDLGAFEVASVDSLFGNGFE